MKQQSIRLGLFIHCGRLWKKTLLNIWHTSCSLFFIHWALLFCSFTCKNPRFIVITVGLAKNIQYHFWGPLKNLGAMGFSPFSPMADPVSRNRLSPRISVSGGYSISIPVYPPPRKITTDGSKFTGIRQYLETCIIDNWIP